MTCPECNKVMDSRSDIAPNYYICECGHDAVIEDWLETEQWIQGDFN